MQIIIKQAYFSISRLDWIDGSVILVLL